MKIILVSRMSSSRLPGKALMPFGKSTLLAHIVSRIELGGIDRNNICIATSNRSEDVPITAAASKLGCNSFTGSLDNVSRRILDAAHGVNGFILVLGDNPWIDPGQVAELVQCSRDIELDYAVTATQELPKPYWPKCFLPIGTRLQYIRTCFMEERLELLDGGVVREHTSKLFLDLPEASSSMVLIPEDGWSADALKMLNISINTEADYSLALTVLDDVGANASAVKATESYIRCLADHL